MWNRLLSLYRKYKRIINYLVVGVMTTVVALAAWFFEIWIDNNFARVKWQAMLRSAWAVALVCGGINIAWE